MGMDPTPEKIALNGLKKEAQETEFSGRWITLATVLLTLGLIYLLKDPPEGSQGVWGLIGPRGRGLVRVIVSAVLFVLWLQFFTSPTLRPILEYFDTANTLDKKGGGSPLLIGIFVSCSWMAWGLHGALVGRNWRDSGGLARTVFLMLGTVFCIVGTITGLDARTLWEKRYYWNNPKFEVLRQNTLKMRELCQEFTGDFQEQSRCLVLNREKLQVLRAEVEELVLRYPQLKERDVVYSDKDATLANAGTVYSYFEFLYLYEAAIGRMQR